MRECAHWRGETPEEAKGESIHFESDDGQMAGMIGNEQAARLARMLKSGDRSFGRCAATNCQAIKERIAAHR